MRGAALFRALYPEEGDEPVNIGETARSTISSLTEKRSEAEMVESIKAAAAACGIAIYGEPLTRREVVIFLESIMHGSDNLSETDRKLLQPLMDGEEGKEEFFDLAFSLMALAVYTGLNKLTAGWSRKANGRSAEEIITGKARYIIYQNWKLTDDEKKKEHTRLTRRQRQQAAKEKRLIAIDEPVVFGSSGVESFPCGMAVMAWLDIMRGSSSIVKELTSCKEGKLPLIFQQRQEISKGTKVDLTVTNSGRNQRYRIRYANSNGIFSLFPGDLEGLAAHKDQAEVMLTFILWKANRQAHNGHLLSDRVRITLKELVDIGIYKNTNSAGNEVYEILNVLRNNSEFEAVVKSKSQTALPENTSDVVEDTSMVEDTSEVVNSTEFKFSGKDLRIKRSNFFKGIEVESGRRGSYIVELKEDLDWSAIAQGYSNIPAYLFRLKGRAFHLLLYICNIARQRTEAVKRDGKFNISMKAIQACLSLPALKGNTNPGRTIVDPILLALDRIEDVQRQEPEENRMFFFTPHYDDSTGRAADFLNGYLEIHVIGKAAENISDVEANREKALAAAEKKARKAD